MNAENLNLRTSPLARTLFLASLKIRRFSLSDLEKVMKIEGFSFPDPWPKSRIKQLCQKYPNDFLIAELSQEIIGYVLGHKMTNGFGFIKRIAVNPGWRRQGIGRKLINLATERLKINGAKKIFLNVRTGNTAAVLFHQNLGFKEVKTIKNYYKNGDDAFLMEKEV